jgi:hypothetical protein
VTPDAFRHPMPFDTRSRRRPLHRLSPALCSRNASMLILRSVVPRPAPIARIASRLSTLAIHRHFRAHVRACFRLYPLSRFYSVHTRVRVARSARRPHAPLANTLTARVHIQRIVIEKVRPFPLGRSHPARASEPSGQSSESTESARKRAASMFA